jgi:hypothetical protein
MRAREFISEKVNKIPANQQSATPGMRSHPSLDNSSPYHPWRFSAHFLAGANGVDDYEHQPDRDGPAGQALVTVAYSKGDAAIIDQAEKAFGKEARHKKLSPPGSSEESDVGTTSPVANWMKPTKEKKSKK